MLLPYDCVSQDSGLTSTSHNPPSAKRSYEEIRALPKCKTKVSIEGYPYDSVLYIKANTLKEGFKLSLSDTSFKILYFELGWNCRACDYWGMMIEGGIVKPKEVIIINRLQSKETLHFAVFNIERNGKACTLPEVLVVLTE